MDKMNKIFISCEEGLGEACRANIAKTKDWQVCDSVYQADGMLCCGRINAEMQKSMILAKCLEVPAVYAETPEEIQMGKLDRKLQLKRETFQELGQGIDMFD